MEWWGTDGQARNASRIRPNAEEALQTGIGHDQASRIVRSAGQGLPASRVIELGARFNGVLVAGAG